MRAHDFINEFAPGDGEDNGRKFIPWEDFVKHVGNMVGDEFSVKMSKIPKQVKAVFTPHDVTKYGPTQIYAYWDRKGVAIHGGFQIGSYQKLDKLYTHYKTGKLGDSKYVDFTLPNVSKFADIIQSNTAGALQPELNEFLDDRKRDDDDEISKIVSTADRLLKQGYRVDLGVVGAMGQVVRADFSLTGFAPNGALAFKRKTKQYIRPFLVDDDDRYEFKMVGPKHYRIVDIWPDDVNETLVQEQSQRRPHLYLDMDGVQADFFTAWAKLFGKERYKEIGDRAQREASISDLNSRGPEFVEKFFATLPVLPGARELIGFLRTNNIPYTILSAPLRGNEEASIRGKLAWLDRHHPGTSATAIFTGEKQRYATSNGEPNVLVDDFKKYVNAWTADGGIAVLYRWNNVNSAIDQLRQIYGIDSNIDSKTNAIEAIKEAVIGTLYPKQILATIRIGDLVIPIHKHLIDRAEERDVDSNAIDRTLRRLPRVKSKIVKQEPGQKFWVYNPHDEISIGLLALDSGAFVANTVIQGAPHSQGNRPIIRMYEESVEENFADGKIKGKSRPGRVKRAGASCDGSVTDLRQRAKNSSGERARMYHWCANMKSGRKK